MAQASYAGVLSRFPFADFVHRQRPFTRRAIGIGEHPGSRSKAARPHPSARRSHMAIELPPLPWARDALAPHIWPRRSTFTTAAPPGLRHQSEQPIKGTEFENLDLEAIIRRPVAAFSTMPRRSGTHVLLERLAPDAGGNDGRLADAINKHLVTSRNSRTSSPRPRSARSARAGAGSCSARTVVWRLRAHRTRKRH